MLLLHRSQLSARTHEDSQTSKSVAKMERRLASSLTAVWNQIKNDISVSSGVGVDFATIRSFYERHVSDLIRASVTEIFIEGGRYASKAAGMPFFITEIDLQQIKQLAAEFTGFFWSGLERELVKKIATAFDPKTLLTMKQVSPNLKDSFVGRLAVSLASRVLSEATLLKAQQVMAGAPEPYAIRSASSSFIPDDYDPLEFLQLYEPTSPLLGLILAQQEQQRTAKASTRVMFVTSKDELVCPICFPLNGKTYDINDPNIPIPVASTHIFCRCKILMLDIKGNIIQG